ncbi:MAG TPA: hypothetical protein VI544_01440 [Candidatus Nanoarchaeia archaeon]|nr:hypothetical protein [Candidatus Nanoarchaeia archaeon]
METENSILEKSPEVEEDVFKEILDELKDSEPIKIQVTRAS